MTHRIQLRVYYEDTDFGGIVYYANYLKFIERARSEWLRDLGIDQRRLKDDLGIVFAVRHVEADYLRPALFEDLLSVTTLLVHIANARVVLDQAVMRGGQTLFTARVTLVCLNLSLRASRVPAELRAVMQN